MLTYKEIKREAFKRYPDKIWERVAFINGAIFFMRKMHPEDESNMDIDYITLD